MENLLSQNIAQSQLSSQHLALILSQHATAETAMNRRSEAFKKVVSEVQTSKEDADRYREKAKYLELDVARTDAYLARTRQLLAQEQSKNAELKIELEKSMKSRKVCDKFLGAENKESRTITSYQSGEDEQSSFRPIRETKKAHRRLQRTEEDRHEEITATQQAPDKNEEQRRKVVTFQPDSCGISFEQHEILIQQAMRMKQELTKLAKQNGQDVDKILDTAECNEIIKRLQRDIQDKADENEILLERINELCSKDDGPASQVVELQFKNDKLQKRLNISQVMIDTLSKRCEELKDEVEMSGQHGKKAECHPIDDSKVFVPIKDTEAKSSAGRDESATQGEDSVDGNVSFKQYDQQKQQLENEIQLLNAQLKQVALNNKQLFEERQGAERQREIYEQRYNKLMETLQDVQQKQGQCSNCRSLELELAKLKREVIDLKDINELIRAQMKLHEEDLRQEQQDSVSLKQKNSFHIEQWKKNCQRMGQQVDLLTDDLRKERDESKRLKHQLSIVKPTNRPAMSLAPTFTTQRCTPKSPKSSPWQEGFGFSDVQCDGPAQDEFDGRDLSDSMGEIHSTASTLTSPGQGSRSSHQSMQSSFSLGQKPLECPRCKREFPPDRMSDFEIHVNKCIDNS